MGIRNIIFRGKTKQGAWVYGLLGCNYFRPNEKYYHIHNCETDDIQYEVIPETIGQYTGLTDKNGKKIFEHDLLLKGFEKVVVKWNSNQCRWGIYSNGYEISGFNESTKDYFEVIGNLHDNPELLEE